MSYIQALFEDGSYQYLPVDGIRASKKISIISNGTPIQRYQTDKKGRIHGNLVEYDPISGVKVSNTKYKHGLKHGSSKLNLILNNRRVFILQDYSKGKLIETFVRYQEPKEEICITIDGQTTITVYKSDGSIDYRHNLENKSYGPKRVRLPNGLYRYEI